MTFKEYFNKIIEEDAIDNIGFEGDWEKDARPRGWDKPSIGILKSPVGIQRLRKKWDKTNYEFDLYFVRSPKGFKYTEVGKVDEKFIKENLGLDIQPVKDHITIIYTNNKGSEKMPATPWTLAHRFGHAIRMGNPMYQKFSRHVDDLLEKVAKLIYGRDIKNNGWGSYDQNKERIKLQLCHALGSFKSARDKNLRNVGEFANELFAEYMITNKIKFRRELPQLLATRYAWGHPQGPYRREMNDNIKEELDEILYDYENTIYWSVDEMVGNAVNGIFVM